MQTVDHSSPSTKQTPPQQTRKPDLHSMKRITVRPVVLRNRSASTRDVRPPDEDTGDAEAHPS